MMSGWKILEGYVIGGIIRLFDALWRVKNPNARGLEVLAGWAVGLVVAVAVGHFLFEVLLGFDRWPGESAS